MSAEPTTPDITPIIELNDVKVHFRTRQGGLFGSRITAVKGVNLAVRPGETVGIVGESGCGKSTTAKVMVGLQEASEGTVRFQGKDVTRPSSALRRKMGRTVSVVFQDPSTALNRRMRVRDTLLDPLNVHNIDTPAERTERVKRLVHLVGLPQSALDTLPSQLSGGQRQRVAIARALALEPDVIIADEPTSALDVSVRAQILNLLTDLKEELNLAMVFISHDIQTVRYISDRICVMNDGLIVEEGPAEQVFDNPTQPYTKTLLGAAPSLLHPVVG